MSEEKKRKTLIIPTFHITGAASELVARERAAKNEGVAYMIKEQDKMMQELRWQSENIVKLDSRMNSVEKSDEEMDAFKTLKKIVMWVCVPVGTLLTLLVGAVITHWVEKNL